jgi:hypothetical protein
MGISDQSTPRTAIVVGFLVVAAGGLFEIGIIVTQGSVAPWPTILLQAQAIIASLIYLVMAWSWWWLLSAIIATGGQEVLVRRASYGYALGFLMLAATYVLGLLWDAESGFGGGWKQTTVSSLSSLGFLIASAGFVWLARSASGAKPAVADLVHFP